MTRRLVLATASLALLYGCAAVPDDAPIVEKLDQDTGLTVARIGRPVEMYRDSFLKDVTGRFAFLGPFETNQMGARETFLWIAVPIELAEIDDPPQVQVDGAPLELGTPGRSPEFAGLMRSPYKVPTPWSATFYYRVDPALLDRLGMAKSLTLQVMEPTRKGPAQVDFAVELDPADSRLRDFAQRH